MGQVLLQPLSGDIDDAARALKLALAGESLTIDVLSGVDAMCQMAALDDVDTVMAAIVGAAGLLPTMAAVKAGRQVAVTR